MGDDLATITVRQRTVDRVLAVRPDDDVPLDEFLAEMAETYAEAADEHRRPYLK